MKPLIDPINTSDGKFHGKDKQTGDLATIVTPEYMNNNQDAARSMQREIISILTAAGINPEEATDTQLLTALKKVLITADDERVKNALQKDNNLSDVVDKTKALENIKGVPDSRKINGHPLIGDTNITAQDIFNGQAIGLSTEDLDALKTPGIYYQPTNANTSAARHYPETNAGTLLVYKNAGVTQVYLVYNSSRTYTRSQYSTGAWTAWAKQYDTANKPTAGDVGAYTKSESDGRFQPKGNYTPAGQAYTKAESDARYQKGNTASRAASGWYKDTNTGIIFQWGTVNRTNYSTPVTFPIAFPSVCVGVSATLRNYIDNISSSGQNIRAVNVSRTGFQYGSGGASENQAFWLAIGY